MTKHSHAVCVTVPPPDGQKSVAPPPKKSENISYALYLYDEDIPIPCIGWCCYFNR